MSNCFVILLFIFFNFMAAATDKVQYSFFDLISNAKKFKNEIDQLFLDAAQCEQCPPELKEKLGEELDFFSVTCWSAPQLSDFCLDIKTFLEAVSGVNS